MKASTIKNKFLLNMIINITLPVKKNQIYFVKLLNKEIFSTENFII